MTVNQPPSSGTLPQDAPDESQRGHRIGRLLRRTRESERLTLADAAASLRIRESYLDAIEHGQYEHLPGPTYVVGFIRAYAEYLGLDGEEAVRRFKREGQAFEAAPDLAFPMPIAERSIPGGRILVLALVLAVCGYGLWYYQTRHGHAPPDRVAAVPAALEQPAVAHGPVTPNLAHAASVAVPAKAIAPPAASPVAVAQPAAAAPAATPKPMPTEPPAAVQPTNVAATVTPPSAPPAPLPLPTKGHAYGATTGPVRVVLRITGDCWIQLKDAKQEVVFSKLLHAGDVYRVPDQPGYTARVGNSAALTVAVDGHDVSLPVGNSRVQNIALDPAVLLAADGDAVPARVAVPAAARAVSQ